MCVVGRRRKKLCTVIKGGVFDFPKFYQDTVYFPNYSTGISDADLKKLKYEASEQVVVWTLLRNADPDKYGGLLRSLKSLKSLQDNKFPKTKERAVAALRNHTWDAA